MKSGAGLTFCFQSLSLLDKNLTNTLSPVVLDGFFILNYSIDSGQNNWGQIVRFLNIHTADRRTYEHLRTCNNGLLACFYGLYKGLDYFVSGTSLINPSDGLYCF